MVSRIASLLGAGLVLCMASTSAYPASAPQPRAIIEAKVAELVALVGAGRMDAMLDRIGPIPDPERPALEETRERLINLYASSGKYSGFDIAGYKVLTPRFQVVYALAYFEKRPVLIEIGFYNVNDAWRAQTLRVEASFKDILDTMPLQK